MACLTIWLENEDSLDLVAKNVGLALGIPVNDHPTDAYNEYPGYFWECKGKNGGHVCLLGSPADAHLMEEINSPYSEEEMQYSLALVYYYDLPCGEGGMIFSSLTADEIYKRVVELLISQDVRIYKKKNPRWVGDGDERKEYVVS